MAVVVAHPQGGVALPPLFRQRVLRIEGQDVLVAAGHLVQAPADPRQVLEGPLQLGRRRRAGPAQLLQPAQKLVVP